MTTPKKPNRGARKQVTDKRRRFAQEYLVDLNQRKAAIRAGYSEKTAATIAWELMRDPQVQQLIQDEIKAQQERTLITADQTLLDIQQIGTDAWKAEDYAQALRSRELIGKRYKLFTDKVEVVNTVPRAERLRAARLRRQQGEDK